MSKLAPKYGISDVGLKKICRILNIPTPARGYWARVQNNIRVEKTPLPKPKPGQPTTYTIQKQDMIQAGNGDEEEKLSEQAIEWLAKINRRAALTVSKRLANPHPLVAKTRDILSKAETDQYGVLIGAWKKQYLDIRVSPGSLARALRIFDAILKFFEREAIPVIVRNEYRNRDSHVTIFKEKVNFFIREPSKQTDHQLTDKEKEELKRYGHAYTHKYDYIPTGKLVLEIDGYGPRCVTKRWMDGKRTVVEDHIHEFVCNVIKIADAKRTRSIEREKEHQQWELERQRRAEQERLRQIELQRRDELEKQAENWIKSRHLRDYIQAVEAAAAQKGISGMSHEGFAFWIRWARGHADRLDPLSRGLPFEDGSENQ
jgi:hypothetical protein